MKAIIKQLGGAMEAEDLSQVEAAFFFVAPPSAKTKAPTVSY
jgi:hypothetical protein